MGNGLIGGLLGAAGGFGEAMTEISKEKRHRLAEKLKLDMMEQMDIRKEGRLEAQHKREKEFENKMPISAADAERLRREEAARSRENEYQSAEEFAKDERGQSYEKENAKTKHGYEMEQIGEQGRWSEKVAGVRAAGSEESVAAQKLRDQQRKEAEENFRRELAAVAEENGIPIESIYNPDLKETTIGGMVTKAELDKLQEIAGGSGFKVRAAKSDETRSRGILSGDDELYKIVGVFSSGEKAAGTGSGDTGKEQGTGSSATSWLKSAVDEVTKAPETPKPPAGGTIADTMNIDPLSKYQKLLMKDDVVWGVTPDGKTERVMVKPSEKIYNNQYDNPKYQEWLELLKKVGK